MLVVVTMHHNMQLVCGDQVRVGLARGLGIAGRSGWSGPMGWPGCGLWVQPGLLGSRGLLGGVGWAVVCGWPSESGAGWAGLWASGFGPRGSGRGLRLQVEILGLGLAVPGLANSE